MERVEALGAADLAVDVPDRGIDVLELLAASDEDLLSRHGRWYIPDRDLRYIRRNALVVLGNVGDGRDPEVDATLRRYLVDPDELLRAHACWACAQLGRTDLLVLKWMMGTTVALTLFVLGKVLML